MITPREFLRPSHVRRRSGVVRRAVDRRRIQPARVLAPPPALVSAEDIRRLPDIALEGDLMVFGHVAAGLVAKKAAPRVSLGVLLVAAEALDILWGVFLLTGVKHLLPSVSPWSHGLLMAAVWLPLACTAIGVPECSLDWSCSATGSWMSSLIPFGRQSNLTCCWSVGRRGWAWVYGSHVAEGSQASCCCPYSAL
jgi:hypothetical protein